MTACTWDIDHCRSHLKVISSLFILWKLCKNDDHNLGTKLQSCQENLSLLNSQLALCKAQSSFTLTTTSLITPTSMSSPTTNPVKPGSLLLIIYNHESTIFKITPNSFISAPKNLPMLMSFYKLALWTFQISNVKPYTSLPATTGPPSSSTSTSPPPPPLPNICFTLHLLQSPGPHPQHHDLANLLHICPVLQAQPPLYRHWLPFWH